MRDLGLLVTPLGLSVSSRGSSSALALARVASVWGVCATVTGVVFAGGAVCAGAPCAPQPLEQSGPRT